MPILGKFQILSGSPGEVAVPDAVADCQEGRAAADRDPGAGKNAQFSINFSINFSVYNDLITSIMTSITTSIMTSIMTRMSRSPTRRTGSRSRPSRSTSTAPSTSSAPGTQCCQMAKFDPFLSLDFAGLECG